MTQDLLLQKLNSCRDLMKEIETLYQTQVSHLSPSKSKKKQQADAVAACATCTKSAITTIDGCITPEQIEEFHYLCKDYPEALEEMLDKLRLESLEFMLKKDYREHIERLRKIITTRISTYQKNHN